MKAVIFDMDGVLVDTERVYNAITSRFFARRGLDIPKRELDAIVGGSISVFRSHLRRWWDQAPMIPGYELDQDVEELLGQTLERELPEFRTIMFDGVPETLATLHGMGIRTALASSSSRRDIDSVLGSCGIEGLFEVVTSGEDFMESKPDPSIYLHTLRMMGLDADECVAVEDSDRGIAAASAAGIPVVVKRDERFGFSQSGGTWVIDDIPELVGICRANLG